MGNKPLGAAFAHARASGEDQSRSAQRRRANRWLKDNGHDTMEAKVSKGILDRWRAMTIDERTDEFNLRAAGITPEVAQALAMQGTGKRPKRVGVFGKSQPAVAKSYATAYRDAAREQLDPDTHAALHRYARASAGGKAARVANRGRSSEENTRLLKRANRLKKRADMLLSRVDKMGPTLSEVHQDTPSASLRGVPRKKKKRGEKVLSGSVTKSARQERVAKFENEMVAAALEGPVAKRHMVAQLANQYVQAAYGAPHLPAPEGGYDPPPEVAPYLDAQRLVAGMDQETAGGAQTPTMARARASAALSSNMGAYDRVVAGPDRTIANVGGLNLDLGSGQARERGFLGLDVFPFDYGTIIHDLGQGIPFPDGSARAVRMCNALDALEDYAQDPTPLLLEIQRVLGLGGKFYYTGRPLQDLVDWSVLPGLGVASHQFGDGGTTLNLVLHRIPAKLPLVYGADTNFLSVEERQPADLALSQATFGTIPSADVAMANLVHKKEHVEVQARVLKKDEWEHTVLGAVLVPDEQDSQGDIISAEDIKETAYNFLINARVVGKEHTDIFDGAQVVECYIAPMDMDFNDPMYGPQTVTKGTWLIRVRLQPEDWQSVLDGTFTGFSVGGWGEREEIAA